MCLFDCVTVVHSKQVSARLGINYDSVRAPRRGGLLRSFHVKELPYHSGSGPKFVKRPLSLITYAKLSLPVTRGVVVVGCNFPPFPGPRQAPCKLGGPCRRGSHLGEMSFAVDDVALYYAVIT